MNFEKKDYPIVKVDGFIEKGKQFDIEINMPEDNRNAIFGVIRDCFKEPVEDAVVKLVEVCDEFDKEERRPVSHTFTDKDGEFVFGPLCPDKNYEIQFWADRVKHVKICADCKHQGKCLKGVKIDCKKSYERFYEKDCDDCKDKKKDYYDDYKSEKKDYYDDYKPERKDCYCDYKPEKKEDYYDDDKSEKKDCYCDYKPEKKDYYDDNKSEKKDYCDDCKSDKKDYYDDKKSDKKDCYDDKKSDKKDYCDDCKSEKKDCYDDKKSDKKDCYDDKKSEKKDCCNDCKPERKNNCYR